MECSASPSFKQCSLRSEQNLQLRINRIRIPDVTMEEAAYVISGKTPHGQGSRAPWSSFGSHLAAEQQVSTEALQLAVVWGFN